MSCLYRIQKAIDYIEENLEDDIVLEDVASITGFSLFHFHRIFQTMVGDSMKDYIRIRRLSNAAHELLYTKAKILDIAIKPVDNVIIANLPAEWVKTANVPEGNEQMILYFHRGGFTFGSCDTHRNLAAIISEASGVDGIGIVSTIKLWVIMLFYTQ